MDKYRSGKAAMGDMHRRLSRPFVSALTLALVLVVVCWVSDPGAAPQKSPSTSSDEVLKAAQLAVSSAQQTISLAQSCLTTIDWAVKIVSGVILVVGLFAGITITKMWKKVPELQRMVNEADAKAAALEARNSEMAKSALEAAKYIKRNGEDLEILNAIYWLDDPNGQRALRALQKLSQRIRPIGIDPMTRILQDSAKRPALRAEAAYGLGRFSEEEHLKEYWPLILECFEQASNHASLPDAVLMGVIEGSGGYGVEAERLLPSIVVHSRTKGKPLIRRTCAETFERIGVPDFDVMQRLEEMINDDPAPEVKSAAEKARDSLRRRKSQEQCS